MNTTILKVFDHKICRSCGQSFVGENDICESCVVEFEDLKSKLQQDENSAYLKFCKYCGRPFIGGFISTRKSSKFFQPTRSEYCKGIDGKGLHFCQCENCGQSVRDFNTANGNLPSKLYCSRKCLNILKQAKTIQTNLKRYGVESVLQSAEVQAKIRKTNLERYGVENYLMKGSTRDIVDSKMREKYGDVTNISQNPEIRQKITDTVTSKYGGYTLASPKLSAKCKQTSLKRYGTQHPMQSVEIQLKRSQTIQQLYGVENLMQSPEILCRMQENSRKKYGTNWPAQSPEIIARRRWTIIRNHANSISDVKMRENYLQFSKDPFTYVKTHFESKPTIRQLSESIGNLDESTIYLHLGPTAGGELLARSYSYMEVEISNFITSLDSNIVISQDNRQAIKPKEIDIYLPDYKIGIECNPTSTHNSSLPYKDLNIDPTPMNYHQMKTDLCEQKGIFLFHIFGYEWTLRPEIIKSMIANLLGKSMFSYYARNLHVEEVPSSLCTAFLNSNHRQGATNAKVRLGLFTSGGTLVSVMTFNKMRMSMGAKKSDTENTWELSRFCSLLNTSVVGGASKLFKYFLRNYQHDKIVSFSDRAHTRGALYETLGFHKVNVSGPNYVWVDYTTDMYYNRVTCQKKNLPKLFDEPDLDIVNQTEKQIMMSHGFVQVFDSGTVRWEYALNRHLDYQ